MTTFLRWRPGEDRRTPHGRFNKLPDGSPIIGMTCPVCFNDLAAGDIPTLFAVGPLTPTDAELDTAGQWYSALAVVGHELCLWPDGELNEGETPGQKG